MTILLGTYLGICVDGGWTWLNLESGAGFRGSYPHLVWGADGTAREAEAVPADAVHTVTCEADHD
jgi:hypothetical protein